MSSLQTLPKGDSAWLLRKAIERIMQQISVLETNIGSSTTGNSNDTEIIFNDSGTLRGDKDFAWNKTSNILTVDGSATITGDLTVDTSTLKVDSANNRVGIGTASPTAGTALDIVSATSNNFVRFTDGVNATGYLGIRAASGAAYLHGNNNVVSLSCSTSNTTPTEQLRITNPGVFEFLDGAGGTRMTLNSTGLGVGGSVTTFGYNKGLTLVDPTSAALGIISGANGFYVGLTSSGGPAINVTNNQSLSIVTGGSTSMVVTSSGNVGIGVTPSAWTTSYNALNIGSGGSIAAYKSANYDQFYIGSNFFENTSGAWRFVNNGYATQYWHNSGSHVWRISTTSNAAGANQPLTWTQAMTLDASGNLNLGVTSSLINTTRRLSVSGTVAAALQSTGAATVETINVWHTATSGNNIFVDFDTEAAVTSRGSISYNRAGGLVAYNTTSDYRAKDIIGPVSNSGSLIDSLKVYAGKMKGATIERPMLIAHEAQEVAPYAVTGTKDEVDADGKPKYQQMDASALVPLLIAEIQSLRARVQTLETR